ncbi:MAG: sulfotransferase [Chitinophagales bacterium]|nr:sulfotransferase [Chitinophagales bacterium]
MSSKEKEYEVSEHSYFMAYYHVWIKLFWRNKIAQSRYKMAAKIWLFCTLAQPFQLLQRLLFNGRIKKVDLKQYPPLFVIGHWRSGTTHLHYILSKDKQFDFLTNYQAMLMNISLIGRTWLKVLLTPLMPDKRPQDNIQLHPDYPSEEEQPFTSLSIHTGGQVFYFPRNISYHDKYHTFKGVTRYEKRRFVKEYTHLLKTIAYLNSGKKPLLLKNPHNTGRVKELKEIFPDAKFIFIHRNPYEVYRSMQHHYKKMIGSQFLQELSEAEIHERILYSYETIMQKYIDDAKQLPKHQLIEIAYTDLEEQPMPTIAKVYEQLTIADFDKVETAMSSYIASLGEYQKNEFKALPANVIQEINIRWQFAFKQWNYEMVHS